MAAVSLQLNMPIQSASVIDEQTDMPIDQTTPKTVDLTQKTQQVDTLCEALRSAAEKFDRSTEELFLSHKEQIVRLSVEIASKILAKDRAERNYEIEKIDRVYFAGLTKKGLQRGYWRNLKKTEIASLNMGSYR